MFNLCLYFVPLHMSTYNKDDIITIIIYFRLPLVRGGSIMVGALRQTTWWGPLVVVRKKNVCVKSDVFKTRQI